MFVTLLSMWPIEVQSWYLTWTGQFYFLKK